MNKLVVIFLTLLAPAAGAVEAELPRLKPGHWENVTQMSNLPGYSHRVHMCVDDATIDLMRSPDTGDCSKRVIQREGDRVIIDMVCEANGSTVTMHGSFSGDFDARYAGKITSTFVPPLQGIASSEMRTTAAYLGPCKAGQKPGDMVMPDLPALPGGVNLNEMMKNLPKAPRQ